MALARDIGIEGRSKMTKEELETALEEADRTRHTSEHRRDELNRRLAKLVELDRRCPWTSLEGHPCGLPAAVGAEQCVLHGGADIADLSIPLTGKLGFDTWPTLMRHLWLASYSIDPLGLDPVVSEMAWHIVNGLYFDYFRVEVEGIENVPMVGPGLIVGNHGGAALPYDAAMLMMAVANEAPLPRRVRVIGTEIFNMLPVISHLYRKAGAAFASREDAARVLNDGHLLGVFPEGERGFMKPIWHAYQLQRFGRGGFVDIARNAGAPIVPVAILGSEEVHPALFVSKTLARLVRMVLPEQRVDAIAVFLNPIPLPVRWRIRFLPPVETDADTDALGLLELTDQIRDTIQRNLDEMVENRDTVF
jgi:1-acyl-sn-glycerol-3-phosphate acyltransferase